MSCYDVTRNHHRYTQQHAIIEEDDVFKIYCDEFGPNDIYSLQLVASEMNHLDDKLITQ